MEKVISKLELTESRINDVLLIVEEVINMSYDVYRANRETGNMGLEGVFFDFGILCKRGDNKALELKEKLSQGHRKVDRLRKEKKSESDKKDEIKKNADDYCLRMKLDPNGEILVKVKEYNSSEGGVVVVGISTVNDRGKSIFGGTTPISEKNTPNLYREIQKNYKRFYE